MIVRKPEEILHDASKEAIKSLVDVMSDSISVSAKQSRIKRIIDDLQVSLEESEQI